jgi:hypothetical protein
MKGTNTYLSIITLHINRLNSPIQRQKLVDWIKNQDPIVFLSTRNSPLQQKPIQTESGGYKMIL